MEPPGREDAEKMPAGKEQGVSCDGLDASQNLVRSSGHVLRRLAAGTSVPKEIPLGPLGPDLDGRSPLVRAVIPFHQVWGDLAPLSEARQLARARRALERAGQHQSEVVPAQLVAEMGCLPLPILREGDVREPRVAAGETPIGLAMADEPHGRKTVDGKQGPMVVLVAPRRPGREPPRAEG
jgi:hypothetical protein